MAEISMSVSHDNPGDPRHDLVAEYRMGLSNVDRERTELNVVLQQRGLEMTYEDVFNDALAAYNAKQIQSGHRERVIDDYLLKIRNSKQEKAEYEMVIQIGNRDTMPATDEGCRKLAAEVYQDFFDEFEKRFPNLAVTTAVIHNDESTPHMHIKYVPFATGQKRGLSTRNSLSGALREMGYKGTNDFNEALHALLKETAKEKGIERLDMNQGGRKHLSVAEFKTRMAHTETYGYTNDPALLQLAVEQSHVIERQEEMIGAAIAELSRVAEGDLDRGRAKELVDNLQQLAERLKTPVQRFKSAVQAIPDAWRDHVINPIADWMRVPFAAPKVGYFPPLDKFTCYENAYSPPWTEWRYEDAHGSYISIRVEQRDEIFTATAQVDGHFEPIYMPHQAGSSAHAALERAHGWLSKQVVERGIALGNSNVLHKTAQGNPLNAAPKPKENRDYRRDVEAAKNAAMPAQRPSIGRRR